MRKARIGRRHDLLSLSLLVATSCGLREGKIKARANGVRAQMAASKRHFAAEAEAICGEL